MGERRARGTAGRMVERFCSRGGTFVEIDRRRGRRSVGVGTTGLSRFDGGSAGRWFETGVRNWDAGVRRR